MFLVTAAVVVLITLWVSFKNGELELVRTEVELENVEVPNAPIVPDEITLIEQDEEILNVEDMETQNVVMQTNKGNITVELFTGAMPITTGNFLKLIGEGFYDGTKFHRVIDGFMVQGGDPNSRGDDRYP